MKIDKDFGLLSTVRQIHSETRGAYGSRRTAARLRMQGHNVGRYRANSLMKKGRGICDAPQKVQNNHGQQA